ncbi:MAG: response regulator transcription factor [Coriobacteriia bacterium]|nr:response regulator transcription factor [Coriobacteriia bacterium]
MEKPADHNSSAQQTAHGILAYRILVIEDDFAIRNSVEFALRRAGYEVKALDSGQEAVQTVRSFNPDLVLLDIMLPHKSGHEICEELRDSDIDLAIIMMSALGETSDRIAGLRLGADDYVSKPFSLDELLERVRANLRRSSRSAADSNKETGRVLCFAATGKVADAADENAAADLLVIDPVKRKVTLRGSDIALRAKEFALLYALASRPGEVLSRRQLSEEVWGQDHLSSSRTIDVHIRRLRALLSQQGAPDYLHTIHGVGYRFDAAEKD